MTYRVWFLAAAFCAFALPSCTKATAKDQPTTRPPVTQPTTRNNELDEAKKQALDAITRANAAERAANDLKELADKTRIRAEEQEKLAAKATAAATQASQDASEAIKLKDAALTNLAAAQTALTVAEKDAARWKQERDDLDERSRSANRFPTSMPVDVHINSGGESSSVSIWVAAISALGSIVVCILGWFAKDAQAENWSFGFSVSAVIFACVATFFMSRWLMPAPTLTATAQVNQAVVKQVNDELGKDSPIPSHRRDLAEEKEMIAKLNAAVRDAEGRINELRNSAANAPTESVMLARYLDLNSETSTLRTQLEGLRADQRQMADLESQLGSLRWLFFGTAYALTACTLFLILFLRHLPLARRRDDRLTDIADERNVADRKQMDELVAVVRNNTDGTTQLKELMTQQQRMLTELWDRRFR